MVGMFLVLLAVGGVFIVVQEITGDTTGDLEDTEQNLEQEAEDTADGALALLENKLGSGDAQTEDPSGSENDGGEDPNMEESQLDRIRDSDSGEKTDNETG
jgi:hypothetical protein